MKQYKSGIIFIILFLLVFSVVVEARPTAVEEEKSLMDEVRPMLISGADLEGICLSDKTGQKWPFYISFTEMDPVTKKLKGTLTWRDNNCITNIEGTYTDSTISFKEISFLKRKKGSVLGTDYVFNKFQEGTFMGTWKWKTDVGRVEFVLEGTALCTDIIEENVEECGMSENYTPENSSPLTLNEYFLLDTPYFGSAYDPANNFTAYFTMIFKSWNAGGTGFVAHMEYPQINSIAKLEGTYEPGKIVMWEKSYIKKGRNAGKLGANFELKDSGNGIYTGTYIQQGMGAGNMTISFHANQPRPKTHIMPSVNIPHPPSYPPPTNHQIYVNRKYYGEADFSRTGKSYAFELRLTWHSEKLKKFSGRMYWPDNNRTIKIKGTYTNTSISFWETGRNGATYTMSYNNGFYKGTWIQKKVGSGNIWFKLR